MMILLILGQLLYHYLNFRWGNAYIIAKEKAGGKRDVSFLLAIKSDSVGARTQDPRLRRALL